MKPPLPDECDRVLLDPAAIANRVSAMAAQITEENAGEHELRLVTVLKGGLYFLADLCRGIEVPLSVDFLAVMPYVAGVGGVVRLTKDLTDDIGGSHVVLVEDVVDTGLTVNYVLSLLRAHGPARLEVCTLLDKPARRIADVPIAYRGFTMPDRFLVGYGLDLNGRYRNLGCIASLRDETVLA